MPRKTHSHRMAVIALLATLATFAMVIFQLLQVLNVNHDQGDQIQVTETQAAPIEASLFRPKKTEVLTEAVPTNGAVTDQFQGTVF